MGNERTGCVILVGAGPGAPDLLTIRALQALRDADVVVHDALVSSEILALVPAHTRRIDVGKRGHAEPRVPQEEIERLLVELARAGRCVVRLKAGDPFVFGRGGEEVSACARAGVPWRVVPGISSALAAPAAAGIPLTDRRHAASFAVATGHRDPGAARGTGVGTLARSADTLVLLMAMGRLDALAREILDGGRDARTPAAAVMWGTTPRQRTLFSNLEKLPVRVREAGLAAPAVVVVGDVVQCPRE